MRPRYRALLESRWVVAIPLTALATAMLAGTSVIQAVGHKSVLLGLYHLAGVTVINVCIAVCIDWCIRFPHGWVGRILNSGPAVAIGVISYSIYLWQQLFIHRGSSAVYSAFPLNILLTAVAAVASYFLVERPSLRLRSLMERGEGGKRRLPASSTLERAARPAAPQSAEAE
jgi:peptidoglycan/LPS O-acetylase OafA/YrhL